MTNQQFREKLNSVSKEKLITAIIKAAGWGFSRNILDDIVREIDNIERKEQFDKEEEISSKHTDAMNAYFKADSDYRDYLFDIARKYGIIEMNDNNEECYNWGKWFSITTQKEKDKALELERIRTQKYKEFKDAENKFFETLHGYKKIG